MTNYNLANPGEVKQALALRLEVLANEKKALDFLADALANYKRAQLNKYFRDHVEALSPRYSVVYTDYNRETHQDETSIKLFPVYSVSINKRPYLADTINLYLHDNQEINGAENYLTFTFYPDHNATTEEGKEATKELTPANLDRLIKAQQEGNKATTAKVKADYDNAEALTAQYNSARQAYDDLLESVHYYTRDQLTGKRDYNLSKRQ